jgi:hypothetical protein
MIAMDSGRRCDPLAPAVWFLVAQAGHVGCDGWTFDRRAGLLRCACGTALYQFHEVDQQRGGSSASPAGIARKAAPDDPG